MLTIWGTKHRFCDGMHRRNFLRVGTLGLAGLTLADVLRLRAQAAATGQSSTKAVIIVCLPGGPSHIDTYDMKPAAPAEIRGVFKPIQTNVPGVDLCELMPRQACMADRLAVIRNLGTEGDAHNLHVPFTGFPKAAGRPAFGSIVSRLQSRGASALPRYVSLVGDHHPEIVGHEDPAYAGSAHGPFVPTGPALENMGLPQGITIERLADRKQLLNAFDGIRRRVDVALDRGDTDGFTAQALEVISSDRARAAFDLDREPEAVRTKYGMDVPLKKQSMYTHYWRGSKFLLARRLVEAGVPVVTLSVGFWDTHADNFVYLREQLPLLDQCLCALLSDLDERGLAEQVAVVVWGEFYGRSPRINKDAGRDHWKSAGSALMAGGGLRTGQVVGATDRRGEQIQGKAYNPQNVLATLYHVLGIDPAQTFADFSGRPTHLLDDREKIAELV